MAGSSGNHYLTLDVLTALAMAEWSTGELDSAALHAEQVATRAGEAGYQQLEGQALITLATIRLSRGSASEAAEHGSRAVAIYRRTGDHLGQARAIHLLSQASPPARQIQEPRAGAGSPRRLATVD